MPVLLQSICEISLLNYNPFRFFFSIFDMLKLKFLLVLIYLLQFLLGYKFITDNFRFSYNPYNIMSSKHVVGIFIL